jgi:hypothetical protein
MERLKEVTEKICEMKKSEIFETAGWFIGVAALGLAYAWFGYQLVIVLMLSFWGRNLERKAAEYSRLEYEIKNSGVKQCDNPIKKSKFQQRLEDAAKRK